MDIPNESFGFGIQEVLKSFNNTHAMIALAANPFQRIHEEIVRLYEPFSEMQKHMEEMMKSHNSAFEALAKQNEMAVKALDSLRMGPFFEEIARTSEQSRKLAELMTPVIDISFLEPRVIPKLHIPYESPDYEEETISVHIITKTPFIHYDGIKDEFSVEGKKINFPDENAEYVVVLKALFTLSKNNKICSFKQIDQSLEAAGKKHIRSKRLKNKRIHNAIAHLQREKADGSTKFPLFTPDGTEVIKSIRGKGFILNNPLI